MLPEEESLIYKYFVDLVRDCDLEKVIKSVSRQDPAVRQIMDNINIEDDRRHNNRIILFQLFKIKSENIFYKFTESLREHKYNDLANKLENKLSEPKGNMKVIILNLLIMFMKMFPAMFKLRL